MNEIHCYNEKCINGIALKNCSHEECDGRKLYPAILERDDKGNYPSYYCSKECKAKVVMEQYNPKSKPRSVKEMQYRLQRMKEEYLARRILNK